MAKYNLIQQPITAYVIKSIGPIDEDGALAADANGNIVVQAGDASSAQTIPFVFSLTSVQGFAAGDFVVAGDTPSLIAQGEFFNTYASA